MTDREHDDAVSRRYRELPAEEPPRALDEAIFAASRRAVQARPAPLVAPTGRRRWYVPLAAAAVIVLAVGLTLRVQLEQPDAEVAMQQRERPAAAPATDQPKMEQSKKDGAMPAKVEVMPEEKPVPERRARARQEAASRAEAPAPFQPDAAAREAPAAPPAPAARGEARALESQVLMRSGPQATPQTAAPGRSDDAARDRAERALSVGAVAGGAVAKRTQEADETPEKALTRIAELRKAGKHDEADKALAEFRKRHPDYRIPEKTLEKVERR